MIVEVIRQNRHGRVTEVLSIGVQYSKRCTAQIMAEW